MIVTVPTTWHLVRENADGALVHAIADSQRAALAQMRDWAVALVTEGCTLQALSGSKVLAHRSDGPVATLSFERCDSRHPCSRHGDIPTEELP